VIGVPSIGVQLSAAERIALQLPPRRAARDAFKKATISRAEGGQLQAPVGPPLGGVYDVLRANNYAPGRGIRCTSASTMDGSMSSGTLACFVV